MSTLITLPSGRKERCSKPGTCKRHNPSGAAAAAFHPSAGQSVGDAFEAAVASEKPVAAEVTSQGLPPLATTAGKRTYADILRCGDKGVKVVPSVDLTTPPGYFVATAKVLGVTTDYLVEGTEGDPNGRIVGRIELGAGGSIYRGSELKGGQFLGTVGGHSSRTFADAFDDIAQGPEPKPQAPLTTPKANGGERARISNYDVNAYSDPANTVVKTATTNGEFIKAIAQKRGETGGAIRRVEARFKKNHGSFPFGSTPVVHGPTDGRPIIIDLPRNAYTNLEVGSGNVVINATNEWGGGVKVRKGAAATIITPGSKFTIEADAGSAVTIYPRAGARGGVWAEEGANVVIDDLFEHEIEDRGRGRR